MVITIALVLVVTFNLVSQFGSVATYAGFVTAGLAVALQNVILAVVAYFFLIGRYRVRVGDRVTMAGVTGRVVDVYAVPDLSLGLFRSPTCIQTGRMVVISNAVLFQPPTLLRTDSGAEYLWHSVTLTIVATSDVEKAYSRLGTTADKVYDTYSAAIQRQHDLAQHFIEFETAAQVPEVRVHLTDNGLECVVRYRVVPEKSARIDQQMPRGVAQGAGGRRAVAARRLRRYGVEMGQLSRLAQHGEPRQVRLHDRVVTGALCIPAACGLDECGADLCRVGQLPQKGAQPAHSGPDLKTRCRVRCRRCHRERRSASAGTNFHFAMLDAVGALADKLNDTAEVSVGCRRLVVTVLHPMLAPRLDALDGDLHARIARCRGELRQVERLAQRLLPALLLEQQLDIRGGSLASIRELEGEVAACRPVPGRGGAIWYAYCSCMRQGSEGGVMGPPRRQPWLSGAGGVRGARLRPAGALLAFAALDAAGGRAFGLLRWRLALAGLAGRRLGSCFRAVRACAPSSIPCGPSGPALRALLASRFASLTRLRARSNLFFGDPRTAAGRPSACSPRRAPAVLPAPRRGCPWCGSLSAIACGGRHHAGQSLFSYCVSPCKGGGSAKGGQCHTIAARLPPWILSTDFVNNPVQSGTPPA